tara:strand:- start:16332 stop:17348 length:1017 start_codon:yes stop_codon:yes gene_type:complete
MKKVLFIVDIEGWAYDDQAKNWKRELKEEFDIDILYLNNFSPNNFGVESKKIISRINRDILNGNNSGSWSAKDLLYLGPDKQRPKSIFDHNEYGLIILFYSNAVFDSRLSGTVMPSEKTLIFVNNEKWEDEGAENFILSVKDYCKGFICCNQYIYDKFSNFHKKIYKASQLVNCNVFYPMKRKIFDKDNFILGYSGSVSNPYKNFSLIKSSALKAGVTLSVAQDLTRKELNDWYSQVDAIICASKSEGGPMCVLEAGATKTPVITARVGLCREFANNSNSYIVKKTKESIISAINMVKDDFVGYNIKSEVLYNDIIRNYTYRSRSNDMKHIISDNLQK